jgi:hypothetical protein
LARVCRHFAIMIRPSPYASDRAAS